MKLSAIVLALSAAVACSACSRDKNEAGQDPTASTTATAAASNKTGTASSASTADEGAHIDADIAAKGPYLFDLLQRPDFLSAFTRLSDAAGLPDWTRQGGTSTPAENVVVGGKSMLMAGACKPHDCPDERIVLLYDEKDRGMWGVYARRKGEAPADVSDSSNDQLTWLGEPDDELKTALKKKLYNLE